MKDGASGKGGGPVVSKSARIATRNRERFRSLHLFTVNLIGAPGSGKTALLERTAREFAGRMAVIEGDIKTTLDSERIRAAGVQAVQIQTGGECHLDAAMVERAAGEIDLESIDVLFIENVGNLVCPSSVDLGEDAKVALTSVAEGDEKPAKYPALFVRAAAVVINKIDLLPYVDYSVERASSDCRKLKPSVEIFPLSVKTGERFAAWMEWIEKGREKARGRRARS
jgi:hydrogenase nickel incorporation protein HypB